MPPNFNRSYEAKRKSNEVAVDEKKTKGFSKEHVMRLLASSITRQLNLLAYTGVTLPC
jgi:hypothetical protein